MDSAKDSNPDPLSFFQNLMFARLSAELEAHREVLGILLANNTSSLQGKTPKDFLDTKIQERLNVILAGLADISPAQATLAAKILLARKKDEPPISG